MSQVQAEREALSLLYILRSQVHPQSECLAALSADQTLSEPVRQRALQIRPRLEIARGLAFQNSELAERDVELGDDFISANCELSSA